MGGRWTDLRSDTRSSHRSGPNPAPQEWGTSLLAHTEFKPGQGILFRLEWREGGKLTRTEEALSRDFAPLTRSFRTDPRTGLRHVVRTTPTPGDLTEDSVGPQRVDRMKISPGLAPMPFLRDGKMVALIAGFGPSFEKAHVSVRGTGFFPSSFHPFPGSEPVGRLDGSVISFEWRGARIRWYLGRNPLPDGVWTVFVKATEGIPSEGREAIPPELAGEGGDGGLLRCP